MKRIQKTVCTLLCIMMILSSFPAVFSASEENTMQKAYIAFSIGDIDTSSNVNFSFSANSSSVQNADVYGVNETFSETSLTWNSALSNIASSNAVTGTHLASVRISGENIYSVDVTDYVKSLKDGGKTEAVFAITPNASNTDAVVIGSKELNSISVYAPDIDNLEEAAFVYNGTSYFSSETPYAYGAGGTRSLNVKKVSSDVNYPDSETGKSIMFEKVALSRNGVGRVKLLNSLTQREFTDADKGTQYSYSFKIRYAEGALGEGVTERKAINVGQIGITGAAQTTLKNSKTLTVKSNEWTSYKYDFVLDDITYSMLGFVQAESDNTPFYVDDLVVTKRMKAPLLNETVSTKDTYIENGNSKSENFGTSAALYVKNGDADKTETDTVSKKAYIKFPLVNADTQNTITLKFDARTSGNQKLNVYAIYDEWNEMALTWTTAPKNNAEGYDTEGEYVGQISLGGNGTYTADVTSFVQKAKTLGCENITFALCADEANTSAVFIDTKENTETTVYAPDIDNLEETAFVYNGTSYFSSETPYAYGAGGTRSLNVKKVSSDVNYPDSETGKSIMFEKAALSKNGVGRVKLLNSLTQREFTDADKGTRYSYSFKIRYAEGALGEGVTERKAINVGQIGITGAAQTTLKNSKTLTVKSNEWTSYKYDFVLDDITYSMLGFVQAESDNTPFYVDDLVVTKELSAQDVAPVLVNGENTIVTNADAMIANAQSRDTSFGNAKTISINYGTNEIISKYRITDEDIEGKVLAKENFKYSRTVKNNNDDAKDVMLVAAVYDSSANLICVKYDNKTIDPHTSEKFAADTGVLPDTVNDSCTLKVMMWETDTLYPIFNSETYSNLYDSDEVVLKVSNPTSGNDYGSFYVFAKTSNKFSNEYIRYNFIYEKADASSTALNANLSAYRIREAHYAQRTGEYTFNIGHRVLQEGEIEMAIREKGASDFIGGFHGDEILVPSSLSLKIDGKDVALNTASDTKGKNVEFLQNTNLNRCGAPDEKVIFSERKYNVTKDGVNLNQKIKWLTSDFILTSKDGSGYLAMFTPCRRTPSNERLLDIIEFYDANGNVYDTTNVSQYEYNGVTGTVQTTPRYSPEIVKAHQYGLESGYEADITTNVVKGPESRYSSSWIRSVDNKIYFGLVPDASPSEGDVWEVNNTYKFDVKKKLGVN